MSLDPKRLKRLAKTCREAGIKHYKDSECEFTLTDDLPLKKSTSTSIVESSSSNSVVNSDTLTEEQLLMWSAEPIVNTKLGALS